MKMEFISVRRNPQDVRKIQENTYRTHFQLERCNSRTDFYLNHLFIFIHSFFNILKISIKFRD